VPRLYVAPTQRRNVLTPVRRQGKGWTTGQLEARYAAAIRNTLIVAFKSLVTKPSFGSHVGSRRTQGTGKAARDILQLQARRALARWVPDITLLAVEPEAIPGEQRLNIDVVWGIGEQVPSVSGEAAWAVGPVKTSITV